MPSDQELSATDWVPSDDGTFVAGMGDVFVRNRDGPVKVAFVLASDIAI